MKHDYCDMVLLPVPSFEMAERKIVKLCVSSGVTLTKNKELNEGNLLINPCTGKISPFTHNVSKCIQPCDVGRMWSYKKLIGESLRGVSISKFFGKIFFISTTSYLGSRLGHGLTFLVCL